MTEFYCLARAASNGKERHDGAKEGAGKPPVASVASSGRETRDGAKEGAGNAPVAGVVSNGGVV